MKKLIISSLAIAGLATLLVSFKSAGTGKIKGRIIPHTAVLQVYTVVKGDTVKARLNGDKFVIANLPRGIYTVWIVAEPGYKSTSVPKVAVMDSVTTNMGDVKIMPLDMGMPMP